MSGQNGDDELLGGHGDDKLRGGEGLDGHDGGKGSDTRDDDSANFGTIPTLHCEEEILV